MVEYLFPLMATWAPNLKNLGASLQKQEWIRELSVILCEMREQ